MAYLGIDIGTSGCKACSFDEEGHVLSHAAEGYQEKRGDGIREIDPAVVKKAVGNVISETARTCREPIRSVCVTCLGESMVLLDEKGEILTGSMVTGDNRGGKEVEELLGKISSEEVFARTGLMPASLYSLPKLMWLKNHTDVIGRARKIFFYEDYIGYLLTGERVVSYSSAARSMAFDIHRLCWDEELLGFAGLSSSAFSTPVPSGTVIGQVGEMAGEIFGLPAGIPVIAGGHDQVCAALGSSLSGMDTAEDGIGTCEFFSVLLLAKRAQAKILSSFDMPYMWYPLADTCFTAAEVTTCGALMNWMRDVPLRAISKDCRDMGQNFFAHMDQRVSGKRTDLLVLPQFGSSGNPDLNLDHMAGTIWGLTLDTKEEDLYLAAKESTVFQIRLALEEASELGILFHRIVLTGGASQSPVTARIRANIFKKPVYTLSNPEAGSLGCMILSAVALGVYQDIPEAVQRVVRFAGEYLPEEKEVAFQEEKYQRFRELYEKMHLFGR